MQDKQGHKESRDKYSLRGKVFESIREDILSGRYEQNTELKETAIGAELGVSRTPVREALRQLELEGLVTIIPNRGAYVNMITAKDVQDIYVIRSMLEGLCARWATEHITQEQLDNLEETLCLTEYHTEKKNYDKLYELDSLFHEQLYEAGGSRILNHVLSDFHDYVKMVRKATISTSSRSVKSTEEHRAIFEAIRDKDADKAEALAKEHVKHTIESIQAYGLDKIL
ncbi:GntR family transcriptional regulator [Clostridiaceae bacterium AF31-3BH]|nr:GntR family transcriptional regulator [Clostridiaceae bacterium AF31-3BH]